MLGIDLDKLDNIIKTLNDSLDRFEAAARDNLDAAMIARDASDNMLWAAKIIEKGTKK